MTTSGDSDVHTFVHLPLYAFHSDYLIFPTSSSMPSLDSSSVQHPPLYLPLRFLICTSSFPLYLPLRFPHLCNTFIYAFHSDFLSVHPHFLYAFHSDFLICATPSTVMPSTQISYLCILSFPLCLPLRFPHLRKS